MLSYSPHSRIMKAFDVVKYIRFGDIQRPVFSMVGTFPFEHSEEIPHRLHYHHGVQQHSWN